MVTTPSDLAGAPTGSETICASEASGVTMATRPAAAHSFRVNGKAARRTGEERAGVEFMNQHFFEKNKRQRLATRPCAQTGPKARQFSSKKQADRD
jgi:hypothetical protein